MKASEIQEKRLDKLLLVDKVKEYEDLIEVIKSEAAKVLSQYMSVESIKVNLEKDDNSFSLSIKAKVNNLSSPKTV